MRAFLERHRVEVAFALSVFVIHGYFYSGQGWNQNARLDGIYAAVEYGSLHIDPFIEIPGGARPNTGDWSKANGHYYPNKAPGTVLVGIPAYWLLFNLERAIGANPTAFRLAHWNAYLINLWLSVFFGALAAGLFLKWLRQEIPEHPDRTLAIAAVCFFGTLVFPFDSQIWGTTTAAYFIIYAWALANLKDFGAGRHVAAGACLGMSLLFDYTAIVPLALLCLYYALVADLRPQIPRLIAGAAPVAIVFLGYHKLVFGSFFTHAVANTNPIFVDPAGGGFFSEIDLHALRMLTTSKFRGFFYFMPAMLFAIPGAVLLFQKGRRLETAICFIGTIASLLFISSFNGWHGGSATGPRYLILSLPFYFILLSGIAHANRVWRLGFYVVGALNAFQMFAIAAVSSAVPFSVRDPIAAVYQSFFQARLELRDRPVRNFGDLTNEQWSMTTFNLGQAMGLGEVASLALILLIATVFAAWLAKRVAERPN